MSVYWGLDVISQACERPSPASSISNTRLTGVDAEGPDLQGSGQVEEEAVVVIAQIGEV